MKRLLKARKTYPDAVILFRFDNFYELFGNDAETVAQLLSLTITYRIEDNHELAMAGFPFSKLEEHMKKLLQANLRVVIMDKP